MSFKIVRYKQLRKVRVGDEILAYGTVTAINSDGSLQTDVGYTMLMFPEGKSVPVVATDLLIVEDARFDGQVGSP